MTTNNPFSSLLQPFKNPLGSNASGGSQPFKFNYASPTAKPFKFNYQPPGKTNQSVLPTSGASLTPLAPNMSTVNGPVAAPAPNFSTSRAIPQVTQNVAPPRPATPTATPTAPTAPTQQQTVGAGTFTTPSGFTVDTMGNIVGGSSIPGSAGATPTPPKPVLPETEKAVQSAEKALMDANRISEEEMATQGDLDRLIESTKKAFQNTSDQPIPLEFITGQLKSVENRALNLAEPLEAKLAREQAKRTAAIESSKFALDRADKRAEAAKKTPEGFTLGKDQVRYDAQGNVIATGLGVGAGVGETGVSQEAQAWAELIGSGRAKLSDVPSDIRSSVANAISQAPKTQTPAQKRSLEQARTAIEAIEEAIPLIEGTSPKGRVFFREGGGPLGLGGFLGAGGAVQDLEGSLDTVRALVGFDALEKMRLASPTGGALGQVSERELAFLQSVAGSLASGQSDQFLIDNLQDIKLSFQKLQLVSSPDGTIVEGATFGLDDEQYIKQGDELIPVSDFNGVGGDTNQALNRPQRNNNPGNVKAGGLADSLATGTDDQGHLIFPSPEVGFQALQQDIAAKISGNSRVVGENPTLVELGKVYAEDPNWANAVAKILGVSPKAKTADINFTSLVQAIARQEGFYA